MTVVRAYPNMKFVLDREIFKLDLTHPEFRLLVYLMGMSCGDYRLQESLSQIAIKTKVSRTVVARSLKKFVSLKLIKIHEKYNEDGGRAPNVIEIHEI